MESVSSEHDSFEVRPSVKPSAPVPPNAAIPHAAILDVRSQSVFAAKDWRDRLGICVSLLCLAHCLMTPIVMALVPVGVALGFWQHGIHQLFLVVVPVVALLAFIPGWKQHGDTRIWIWGASGVLLLAGGVAFAEVFGHGEPGLWTPLAGELLLTIAGGGCLIRAHLLNRALCACCDHGHDQVQ